MERFGHFKLFFIYSIFIVLFIFSEVYALTGKEIIEKSEQLVQGNTQISVINITIKTRRWTRTMKMKSYMDRHKPMKSFADIVSPKKDAGNRFLMLGDRMWHYVPKLQQTIKISPSMMLQSWMGSDFTNDDIVKESSIINDYTHNLLGKEIVEGFECYKVELIPNPDAAVVWGKVIYCARTDNFLPVRQEYYNEHQVKKKVMTYSKFKKMDDRIIPTEYKMQTVSKKNRHTIMEITAAKFNVRIPDDIFTLQNLKRK
ncbi:outer membrane lipoprotein-sorting protein [Desulfobacterales bacterium HSG16]|nr:outer membrane lipoprotein-sorting protein [Desulfobacterales bacterium HSG16]